jgi:membrane protein YqaA with SNARE-associated domain
MRWFSVMYDRTLVWAAHRHAPWYLGGMSFAESSFFPVPVDVMLAPMTLARPERWWWYAAIAAVTSAAGGVAGYLIGYFALDAVTPLLHRMGWWEHYLLAHEWFGRWGVWVVFIAGFSPIPYKVFTIASGAAAMAIIPFVVASLVGRAARFFLVAGLVRVYGPRIEPLLRRHVDTIGWATVAIAIVAWLLLRE